LALKFKAIADETAKKNSREILFCCNLYWKSCWWPRCKFYQLIYL